ALWRLAQVAQELHDSADGATEFVIAGDTRLLAARAEVAAAEASGDGERMAHAYTALHDAGAHDARARAQALLLGLGFQLAELDQPVRSFSGGWRMRLQLARALMCPSDLLLLDEPTNHLDLDALVWLESWLQRYPGTLLVISHDREFLDAVTAVTLHLEGGQLRRYGGNYSRFELMRAQALAQQQQAYARQQAHIARLQQFIDRFKAKATKARQAQSRIKALQRMETIGPVLAEAEFTFTFQPPASLPNPMLVLQDVSCGYPPPADAPAGAAPAVIVRHVNRSVLPGQRIGILGANGQGKSTLVKTIARALPPVAGRIVEGKGLAIGYFAQQELDVLRPQDTALQHMVRLARETEQAARLTGQATREQDLRTFLGSFQFSGDMLQQTVGSMSGGEKARLVLCMLVWQRPNLLLLDEPTNHLDLSTREALSVALNEFEGTVMLVSHDRALLREVCDEFWLVSGGTLTPFDGDLDDYQRLLLEQARQRREALKPPSSATATAVRAAPPGPSGAAGAPRPARENNRTRQMRKELQECEARLAALAQERADIEARLGTQPTLDEIHTLSQRMAELQTEVEQLEARWLELGSALEE
ncbi:MAG: ABC-F family ATP-binding cassette domain-containing protein, partial [Hylemonella sp.]